MRRWNDPDDTDGRALYRALANAEARRSLAMKRRVRLRAENEPATLQTSATANTEQNDG